MNGSTRKLKKNFKKFMETNVNQNTTVQNLRDTAKVVLRGKYIVIQAFLKKQERSQIHNLTLHQRSWRKNSKESLNPAGEEK